MPMQIRRPNPNHVWRPQGGVCIRCKSRIRRPDELGALTRRGDRMICVDCANEIEQQSILLTE
jgi:hypothetical protein